MAESPSSLNISLEQDLPHKLGPLNISDDEGKGRNYDNEENLPNSTESFKYTSMACITEGVLNQKEISETGDTQKIKTNDFFMAGMNSNFTAEINDICMTDMSHTLTIETDNNMIGTNNIFEAETNDKLRIEANNKLMTEANDKLRTEANDIFTTEANNFLMTGANNALAVEVNDIFITDANNAMARENNTFTTEVNNLLMTGMKNVCVAEANDSFMTEMSNTFTTEANDSLYGTETYTLSKINISENAVDEKEPDSKAFHQLCLAFAAKEQLGEKELEEDIKNLKKLSRKIASVLYEVKINPRGENQIICEKARELFSEVHKAYASLAEKVPRERYYKFNRLWKSVTHDLVGHASFMKYVESGKFLPKTEAAEILGLVDEPSEGFYLDLCDYLMGVSQFPKELVHLSRRCAIQGQYEKCIHILNYITNLKLGFKRLNLKNNQLRRRYDTLKYQKKRAKTIVMDLKKYGHIECEEDTCHDSDD